MDRPTIEELKKPGHCVGNYESTDSSCRKCRAVFPCKSRTMNMVRTQQSPTTPMEKFLTAMRGEFYLVETEEKEEGCLLSFSRNKEHGTAVYIGFFTDGVIEATINKKTFELGPNEPEMYNDYVRLLLSKVDSC